jgi:hypothetical protein
MQTETRAACLKPLVDGGDFCAFCGTRRTPLLTTTAIDVYVQNRLNLEMSNRLKDQASLVREIGDKAEDVVWKRLKLFGALLTVILGFIAFIGIKTLDDISKRIEPIISAAEQRAQAAKRTIEETAARVNSVKVSVDQLSTAVDGQKRRVAESGGEIAQKLRGLDATATDAQRRGELYQARSEELARRFEAMETALESKATEVSKQVDNVSIRQAYPTLGQQRFVTYSNAPWKGLAGKVPNDKWINIFISGGGNSRLLR